MVNQPAKMVVMVSYSVLSENYRNRVEIRFSDATVKKKKDLSKEMRFFFSILFHVNSFVTS